MRKQILHWTGINEIETILTRFMVEVEQVNQRVLLVCRDCKFTVTYPNPDLQATPLNRIVADALRHLQLEHDHVPSWAYHFIRDYVEEC